MKVKKERKKRKKEAKSFYRIVDVKLFDQIVDDKFGPLYFNS